MLKEILASAEKNKSRKVERRKCLSQEVAGIIKKYLDVRYISEKQIISLDEIMHKQKGKKITSGSVECDAIA